MRLVFAGTPSVAAVALEAVMASSHDVVAVLTRPDARSGRGRKKAVNPVKDMAEDAGIPVWQPESLAGEEFATQLKSAEVDCVPVVAYGALVPESALSIPRCGWVNLHFSLLPAWRGAAPVQHAVMAGDEVTGACVFQLDKGLDTGPVYSTMTAPIAPGDTSGDLLARLAVSGGTLLVDTLDALEAGEAFAVPQSAQGTSYAPRLTTRDARIVWDRPAPAIDRHVRGVTPAPGAWTTFRGARVKVGPVKSVHSPMEVAQAVGERINMADVQAGTVLAVDGDVLVTSAAGGAVSLDTVQPAGKKVMAASDWARGLRLGVASGQSVDNLDVMGEDDAQ